MYVGIPGGGGMRTYPPNLKITLVINKNGSLAFGMRGGYFVKKKSLKERNGSEF